MADPDALQSVAVPLTVASDLSTTVRSLVARVGAAAGSELESLVTIRIPDLADYQNLSYAERYANLVGRAREAEEAPGGVGQPFAEAVAVQLHRVMAYKDEYEVARLHLSADFGRDVESTFGPRAKVTYHLDPPILHRQGLRRKIRVRITAPVAFRVLRALRVLRGRPRTPSVT